MDRPTFLILGPSRTGTTSLYYYLSQHPDVCMSFSKEPPFFQVEYERGLEYYWKTYFQAYSGQRHAGEAAHQNFRLPYVTPRIAESIPDARFFVLCRNPVDRAFSAYWYNVTRSQEYRSFEQAIQDNLRRLETGPLFEDEREARLYAEAVHNHGPKDQVPYASYLDSGYYARHIDRFAATFGRDRIRIFFFEDLVRDPHSVVRDAFAFLDLEPVPLRDPRGQNSPVSPALAEVFKRVKKLPGMARVPIEWQMRVRRALGALFPSSKPRLAPETRRMLSDHFQPHNEELSRLTGRDLAHWRFPRGVGSEREQRGFAQRADGR